LPQPLNALPISGYLKQLPKFTREGDITTKEHLASFYSYVDKYVIVDKYVWMRIFVHSLDGEARNWFRSMSLGSIAGIEALDDVFLRQYGDKKDFMYYIIELGSLKRKEGESISDSSKIFNKMYNKIPAEIKPIEAFAKITYAIAFDPNFCLLLRERRDASLAHMQYASLQVESNILGFYRLMNKVDRDRVRGRVEASTSSSSALPPQMDEVTKLLKSLSDRMERLELEGKQTYRNPQNVDNRGKFRRSNRNDPRIIQREPRNRYRDDQKIQTPLHNNLFMDDGGEEEDLDLEIHCLEDAYPSPHLTQSAYVESLMEIQLNELSKGDKASDSPNRYNLRSKKKDGKYGILDHPPREDKPTKDTANNSKEKIAQNPPPIAKGPIP
jgi:hypothetical protein